MNLFGKPIFKNEKKKRRKPKSKQIGKEGYDKIKTSSSKPEQEIYQFIVENTNNKVLVGNRTILQGREIDIIIPALKLAVEFNGDYWHSFDKKEYWEHLHKTKNCEHKGFRLIQIWENEWKNNQDYVKYILKCYLKGQIPIHNRYFVNRDYFSKLDFPDAIEIKPKISYSGKYKVVKSGWLKVGENL